MPLLASLMLRLTNQQCPSATTEDATCKLVYAYTFDFKSGIFTHDQVNIFTLTQDVSTSMIMTKSSII